MSPPHGSRLAGAMALAAFWAISASGAAQPAAAAPAQPATQPPEQAPAATPPPAPPAARPAEASEPPTPAQYDLDRARTLFHKKQYDEALKVLTRTLGEPGATPAVVEQVHVAQAEVLMARRHPEEAAARALVLQVLHDDHDGAEFDDASAAVRTIADDLRDEHVFVLHEPHPYSRVGRPLKIRARVVDPKDVVASVVLHFRGQGMSDYSDAPMNHSESGWTYLLREPRSLAPVQYADEFTVEYYLTAVDTAGHEVDRDGSPDDPIATLISTTRAEKAEAAAGVDLNAITQAENTRPPPPVIVPVTPWYLRWYTFTAEGVIVAGVVTAIVLASTRPQAKLPENMGVLKFPLGAQ